MSSYKIIFTGPESAGVTTAINALSDTPTLSGDEGNGIHQDGQMVGLVPDLDYGVINLGDEQKIHLYGTPGKERFDFMWDILTVRGIGLVILLNNTRPDPYQDMRYYFNMFKSFIEDTQVVIGITHKDQAYYPKISDYHMHLGQMNFNIPVFEVDARKKKDLSLLLEAMLYSLDQGVGG